MTASSDPRRERLDEVLAEMREHYEAGRKNEGADCCRQARDLLLALTAEHADDAELLDLLASMHYNLGNAHSDRGEHDRAEQCYRLALPIQQCLVREHPEQPDPRTHLARCLFNLGNTFMATGRLKEAAEHHRASQKQWKELIEREPHPEHRHDLARSLFNLGYVLECQGDAAAAQSTYRQAQAVWRQLLADQPGEAAYEYDLGRCYLNLAVSLWQTGSTDDAIAAADQGVPLLDDLAERWPDTFEFQRERLDALHRQLEMHRLAGHVDRVTSLYDRVGSLHLDMLRRYAGGPEQWDALGRLHLRMASWYGQTVASPADAERAYLHGLVVFEEMESLHPGPEPRHLIACILFDLGMNDREGGRPDRSEERFRRALVMWQRLVQAHPGEEAYFNQLAACHNNLGILYADTGRLDRAEEHYRQALAMREAWLKDHPGDVTIQTYLGGALCNLGNVAWSRRLFRTAHGWYVRSIQALEPLLQARSPHPLVQPFLKNARDGEQGSRDRDDYPDWRAEYATATVGLRPAGPPPRLLDHGIPFPDEASLECFTRGDHTGALQALDQRLAQSPADAAGWFWKGRLLIRLGRHEEALAAFARVLELQPGHVPAWHDRADMLRYLNRPVEALEAVERALALDERHADAWYLRGLILGGFLDDGEHGPEPVSRERLADAVEVFDRAILLRPDFFEARLFKGRTLNHLCHALQAHWRVFHDSLSTRMSERDRGECLRPVELLFHCCCRRTLESLEWSARLRPTDATPWYERGRTLIDLMSGHEEEALTAFNRAVELQPNLANAWYDLARLHNQRNEPEQARACLDRALALHPPLAENARRDFPAGSD